MQSQLVKICFERKIWDFIADGVVITKIVGQISGDSLAEGKPDEVGDWGAEEG